MELNQLRCFLAVAQAGSITKAAERLYITQSALSRVIQRLESEIGTQLFDRDHKKMVLNKNGQLFQFYVAQAMKQIDTGLQAISAATGQNSAPFRIRNDLVTDFISAVYDICQAENPTINLQFCRYYGDSDSELDKNDIPDILITSEPNAMGTEVIAEYQEIWCVIAERGRAKRLGPAITLEQLAEEPIVFYGSEADFNFLRNTFMSNQISPKIITVESFKQSSNLINKGLAVACVPLSLCHEYDPFTPSNVPFVPIRVEEELFSREIYLCLSRNFQRTPEHLGILNRIQQNLEATINAADSLL